MDNQYNLNIHLSNFNKKLQLNTLKHKMFTIS